MVHVMREGRVLVERAPELDSASLSLLWVGCLPELLSCRSSRGACQLGFINNRASDQDRLASEGEARMQ